MPDAEGWTPAPGEAAANIVWYVPILVCGAALLFAIIEIWWAPRPITRAVVIDKLLRYLFFFPLGVQGLWAFFCHVFLPEESAAAIGWAPSPFQYEVGVANLGLALASFYAAFSGFQARAATAVAAACFLVGAGLGHIQDIVEEGNFAPGNAGPIMLTDFLTPMVILVLLLATPRHRPQLPSTPRLEQALEGARKKMRTDLRRPGK
jgi:Na+/melibiose symporter-like transporter